MPKFEVRMIETLYHVVKVEAENEEEVRKIFNGNEIDWDSADCYDATVDIDEIIEMVSEEDV